MSNPDALFRQIIADQIGFCKEDRSQAMVQMLSWCIDFHIAYGGTHFMALSFEKIVLMRSSMEYRVNHDLPEHAYEEVMPD